MRRAIVVLLCSALAACGGDGDDDPSAKRTPAATPEATATPAPAPVMFGSQRYISPCSVLPMSEAERIYGAMGPLGYMRQNFFDASLSRAEFRRATANVSNSVATVCDYNRRDKRNTSVKVTVEQFRSPQAARAQWTSIAYLGTGKESRELAKKDLKGPFGDFTFIKKLARENEINMGGKPVSGAKGVLYVKGRADFVGVRSNALVRLQYLPLSFSTPVFGRAQYRKQAAKARKAFRVIFEQLDRTDLPQAPAPPAIGPEKEVNGAPYLDPCTVLDERVFRLATGRDPTDDAESVSLPLDTAALREAADELYGQSPETSCSRDARYKRRPRDRLSRSDHADLAVRVAARPQGDQIRSVGTELAGDWIINRYINKDARDRATVRALVNAGVVEQVTADQTDADALYIFDSTLKTGSRRAFREAFFNVGPYAFRLSVKRNSGLALYSGKDLSAGAYRRVVDAIAAQVRAGMEK